MTTRLATRFAQCAAEGRAALVTFVTAGDPDHVTAQAILHALPGAGAAAAARGSEMPAPVQANVTTPFAETGFQQALGYQVSLLARDGIGQAELHLNPADMGPVEVRIHLDGDAARVMMSADLAPTRQWLEQALPTLAATLRDAGLTLAGGGVFEQAGGGHQQSAGGVPMALSGAVGMSPPIDHADRGSAPGDHAQQSNLKVIRLVDTQLLNDGWHPEIDGVETQQTAEIHQ